jgi:hypothetical protein
VSRYVTLRYAIIYLVPLFFRWVGAGRSGGGARRSGGKCPDHGRQRRVQPNHLVSVVSVGSVRSVGSVGPVGSVGSGHILESRRGEKEERRRGNRGEGSVPEIMAVNSAQKASRKGSERRRYSP